jgi:hypothetical protein
MNEFKDITEISDQVIKAATEVHQIIGPGMMESVYQECLSHELQLRGIPFERHKELTIEYKDATLHWTAVIVWILLWQINLSWSSNQKTISSQSMPPNCSPTCF